jgi:hypothetical protein
VTLLLPQLPHRSHYHHHTIIINIHMKEDKVKKDIKEYNHTGALRQRQNRYQIHRLLMDKTTDYRSVSRLDK